MSSSAVPSTMRAVIFNAYGDLDQLKYVTDFPVPQPDDREVLVQLHAAAINPIDWKVLNGLFKSFLQKTFPVVVGWDGAGVVVQVGKDVKNFKPGDDVFVAPNNTPKGGTFADYCCAHEDTVAKKPSNISFAAAAAFPVASITAFQTLEEANVKNGSKILVLGGSGGVGSAVVQIAKALGAHVFATCSTANIDLVKSLGADSVIDYKTAKWEEVLKGQNLDAVIDTVGEKSFGPAKQVLKKGGIFVTIAGAPENDSDGYTFRFVSTAGRPGGRNLAKVAELIQAGKVRATIDTTYQFNRDQVLEMFKYSKSERAKGKLVLLILPDASGKEEKKAISMRAVRFHEYGGPQNLRVEEISIPAPADDELLVKVHAAAINPIDWKILSGKYQSFAPRKLPAIPGYDVSGVVVNIGKNVTHFKPGDEVYSDTLNLQPRSGTFAEYCCIVEAKAAKKPRSISHIEAASIPLVVITSWQALEAAKVSKGSKVLILGGSGGCGLFGVQIAKAWGAQVTATCGTDNVDFVKSFGANEVIDYKKSNWGEVLKGQNFDVVYDTVGVQGSFEAGTQVLRKGGIFVSIAGQGQSTPDHTYVRIIADTNEGGKLLTKVAELVEAGKIRPSVEKVYDFNVEQVQQLFKHSESARARGKLVLKVVN